MKTMPLAVAKAKLSSLVDAVESGEEGVTITRHGKPAAVLVSQDEFDSWQETIAIRSDAALMREIRRGLKALRRTRRLYTLDDLFGPSRPQ
ncbi:MAG TPA: type II toxin-antitoxin system Phd/YefM family antitoxin [Gemmatimonadales bacterium]|nr:type II toxin-antitoxin system Phd/YefM family antitoxin [Gemmatimonadales bacterium]